MTKQTSSAPRPTTADPACRACGQPAPHLRLASVYAQGRWPWRDWICDACHKALAKAAADWLAERRRAK